MIKSLHNYNIDIDASDTGTGKTYCALSIAKKLNLKPLIICPKSVKHNCEIYHNRDKNAVQNMLKIVKSIFNTGKRPKVFCRSC